jgi:16S rRNA (uracil1498-N3)-methyltransferase
MAWESSTESVARALASLGGSTDSVTLIVGPEGGFTDQEAAMAERRGVSLVSLGPRVLRAETAAIALATLVLYACGDLESAAPASPR